MNWPLSIPVALLVGIGTVIASVLVWVLYRSQARVVSRGWAIALPVLKAFAVVALLISLVKPMILRPARQEDVGPVVLLADDSPSMKAAADSSWTPAELVTLADALGELPARRRKTYQELKGEFARLRERIDEAGRAAGELEYARLSGQSLEPAVAHASQSARGVVELAAALTAKEPALPPELRQVVGRWSDAGSVIAANPKDAWAELRARAMAAADAVDAFQSRFDADLYAHDAQVRQACDALNHLPRVELAMRIADRGVRRQIPGTPVQVETLSTYRPSPRSPQAVVLLSDGRSAIPSLPAASPLFTVRCAPAVVRDVAVEQVAAPMTQTFARPAKVGVTVRSVGYDGATVALELSAGNGQQTKSIQIPAGGHASAEFAVPLAGGGFQRVTARVVPVDGECSSANNAASGWVKVISSPTKVHLEGPETPGIRALRDALKGDAATSLVPDDECSVLVLHDTVLTPERSQAIREFVADRGGTAIFVAGRSAWPLDAPAEATVADLLPYRPTSASLWRTWPGEIGFFSPAPAAGAESLPPLQIGRPWTNLPPLFAYLQLGPLKADVRTLLVERGSGAPLLTEQRIGAGRVLFLAFDEAWRWREVAAHFWSKLIEYAAGEPYAIEESGFALDIDRPDVLATDTVHVRAKLPAVHASRPTVQLLAGDRVVRTDPLIPTAGQDRYAAFLRDLPVGAYTLRLDAGDDDGGVPAPEVPLRVSAVSPADLTNLRPDDSTLRRLAESTAGFFVPATDVARIPDEILRLRDLRPRSVEYALWDSPYLFVFVVSCFATEWALRKRLGLA